VGNATAEEGNALPLTFLSTLPPYVAAVEIEGWRLTRTWYLIPGIVSRLEETRHSEISTVSCQRSRLSSTVPTIHEAGPPGGESGRLRRTGGPRPFVVANYQKLVTNGQDSQPLPADNAWR
jgi:hypothetical protein